MNTHLHRSRLAIAILASLLFAMQMLLSSWVMASTAGQPMLDAFGNPLCVTGSVDRDTTPSSNHTKLPTCCTVGCSAFSSALPVYAHPVGITIVVGREVTSAFPRQIIAVVGSEYDPGSPRAPPLTS